MRSKILCVFLLATTALADDLDLVMSFVTMDERPVSVLMPHICWSHYTLKTLTKRFCDVAIPFGYSFQPNRTEFYLQHVVVLADLSCPGTDKFLEKASERAFFKSPYRWLILNTRGESLDVLDRLSLLIDSDVVIAQTANGKFNLMEGFEIAALHEAKKLMSNCKFSQSVGQMYDANYFMDYQIHYNINYNTRDTLINTVQYYWKLDIYNISNNSVYKINDQSEVIFTLRATWTKLSEEKPISQSSRNQTTTIVIYEPMDNENRASKFGLLEDYRTSKVLSSRRRNLKQTPLTMVNVITDTNDTLNHLEDRLFLHQDLIAKMSYMAAKICFEMLNATIKSKFTNTWGYKDTNGNWQGVVDLMINKEADLGTMSIFTQDRMMVEDYIALVATTSVRFVFREPPLAYMTNIFALPFSGSVWLAIIICVLGCALLLFFTSKWEASMSMHPLQLDGSWADVLILIIGAVLQQGCTLEPRYAAGRVVMLILFIAMTILYAAYSANIVVLLRAPSSSVRTLQDLLNSPLKLGASDFEYNRYFLKNVKDPLRKAIYDKKIAPKGKKPNFYNMKEGVEKLRQGLFAFHIELNPGYRMIQETFQEDEKCDLVEIDYLNEIDPWVPGQKRGAHKDLFKINFIKIRERGVQSCLTRRLYVPKPKCSGSLSSFSSVGITDMYPAMLATLYGFLLAPAVLVLEIAYHRLLKARQKRSQLRQHDTENSRKIYTTDVTG